MPQIPLTMTDSDQILAQMLDALDICIQAVDRNGTIIFSSRGVEQLEDIRRTEVLGKNLAEVYLTEGHDHVDPKSSALLRVLKDGKPQLGKYMLYYVGEKRLNIITDAYPVFQDGELAGAIAMFRDVAKAKRAAWDIIELEKNLLLQRGHEPGGDFTLNDIICRSDNMLEALKIARRASANEMAVLIEGETGTGKEMFAQGIHHHSSRADGPFVAINCAAIPDNLLESMLFGTSRGAFTGAVEKAGLLEKAENGSLFLDEIHAMPIHLQSKLLRALQTRRFMRVGGDREIAFNARLISAINGDPRVAIRQNLLREDIYYRIAVMYLKIPPLRERAACLPVLIEHFLKQANETLGKQIRALSPEVTTVFDDYDWPGNVRELEHSIAYGVALADYEAETLGAELLPPHLKEKFAAPAELRTEPPRADDGITLQEYLRRCETDFLRRKSEQFDGNVTRMAENIGVSRQNLQYRLRRLRSQ